MPIVAGKDVGPIGLGLMSLTRPHNGLSDDDCFAVLKAALDAGCNFWNGGEFYGPEDNNSLVLLEKRHGPPQHVQGRQQPRQRAPLRPRLQLRSQDDLNWAAKMFPRFAPENMAKNLEFVDEVAAYAAAKGCTTAQLAINWARCQSQRPGMPVVIPIPGGTTVARTLENLTLVDLTNADLDALDVIRNKFQVHGDRYPPGLPGKS